MKIVIIGAGDVGYHIAETLSKEHHDVVVIEIRDELVRRVGETLDVQVVKGSGAHPDILQQAGIAEADMLIAATDRDEVNMIACLIASSQAKIPTKIARVRDEAYTEVIERSARNVLNIDLVIHPEREAVDAAIRLIEIPGAREVVQFAEGRIVLAGISVEEDSPIIGRPLQEFQSVQSGRKEKILIVAILRGTQLIIPRGKDEVKPNDELFIIAERDRLVTALQTIGKEEHPTRRVMIFGYSQLSVFMAHRLENRSIPTKLICEDQNRCASLVEQFEKLIVLHGEGSDQALLKEENVQGVDYFISASEDEEANILVSLLAKRLGARRTMALVSRLSYASLISSIGVDVVLNPQMAAVNRILRYIRRGKVLSVATVGEERAEAIEVIALETSDLVNMPLKHIHFPKDAIIGAAVRNEHVIIPNGETVILPGDRVIIFAKRKAIPSVEKALTVKLEYF